MKTLPHDYAEKALLPDSVLGNKETRDYVTKDGVSVRLSYRGEFNNTDGVSKDILDRVCRQLYGVPFKVVERRWCLNYRVDGWWSLVDMKRVEDIKVTKTRKR